jgi:hypothetical protein
MIDGDDISQSDLSIPILDLLIAAGERRLYRQVRSSTQDTSFTLITTGNAAPLPADFLEFHGAPFLSTFPVCVYAPWEAIQNAINSNANISADAPAFYGFQSDAVIFFPPQADGTTVQGQYYKKFADISTGLNALFTRHPDLFLYAALAESAPFLGEMDRLPIWVREYENLVQLVNDEEKRRYTRGGKLQTRVA